MKKIFIFKIVITFCLLFIPDISTGRDFIVQFREENYKQTNQEYSNFPEVYHSMQVMTVAGPKLLVLSGENHSYRTWLRHYIAEDKSFIAKIPDSEIDLFVSSKVFIIDVTAIHPFNEKKWEPVEVSDQSAGFLDDGNRILIIDANEKRSRLIASVIDNMGYTPTVLSDGTQALQSFKQQPEKYNMIILDYAIPGISPEEFIKKVVAIDHKIPVIIGSGYKNKANQEKFSNTFSSAGSVMVVPVILEDLKSRIKQLLNQKV